MTRFLSWMGASAVAIAFVSLAGASLAGQTATARKITPGAKNADVHRTLWGDPDLQGIWTGSTITPLERPEKFAGKEFLTEAEAA